MILYSVIIPHKNRPDLLKKLIGTIPVRDDIEILIVDDKSDDGVLQVLTELEEQRENVQILKNENAESKGAGQARNIGLKNASGNYVLFADSDDYFTEEAFKNFDEAIADDPNSDLIYFKCKSVDENAEPSNRSDIYNLIIDKCKLASGNVLEDPRSINILNRFDPPWSKLYRHEYLKKNSILFEEVRYSNDVVFNSRCLYNKPRISISNRVVYVVLNHSNSLIKERSAEMIRTRFAECIKSNTLLREMCGRKVQQSITGGFIIDMLKFSWSEAFQLLITSIKKRVPLFYPIHRYLSALFMKWAGKKEIDIRFYILFGKSV